MENNYTGMADKEKKQLIKKIIARFSFILILLFLIILLSAGTFVYWQVYVYFAVLVIPVIFVLFYFVKKDIRFLERRMKIKEKEKEQKLIQWVFSIFYFAGYIVSGLDKRFGWSDIPTNIVVMADIIIFIGYLLIFFVFKENSFASRIIDVEENQKVISTGLYGIVRHPMYIGVIMMYVPSPIALGSYWGLIPMGTIPIYLILRILNEEKILRRDLPGYTEYCGKTKYRLIPFIW